MVIQLRIYTVRDRSTTFCSGFPGPKRYKCSIPSERPAAQLRILLNACGRFQAGALLGTPKWSWVVDVKTYHLLGGNRCINCCYIFFKSKNWRGILRPVSVEGVMDAGTKFATSAFQHDDPVTLNAQGHGHSFIGRIQHLTSHKVLVTVMTLGHHHEPLITSHLINLMPCHKQADVAVYLLSITLPLRLA
jgi:hypothetical protein